MLEDATRIRCVVLACGTIDLRKGIDGLAMIIGDIPGTRKVLKIKHFLYFLLEFTNDLPIILESRACRF